MNEYNNREAMSSYLPLYIKSKRLGRVHSKYKNGLNIQFDDLIIFIGSTDSHLSAFGLNINRDKLTKLLHNIQVGNVIINKNEKFIFYGINEIITVDYRNALEVDLGIPRVLCGLDKIPYTKLYKQLEKIQFEEYIGIDIDDQTRPYIEMLLNSDKSDVKLNLEIIKYFSGRGKGLTPSGDDILIGFSLGLKLFQESDNWMDALILGINAKLTTAISLSYLRAFIDGFISENFIQLVRLLDYDDEMQILNLIRNIQSFGHTSGYDTLFGFYLGLKYLIKLTKKEEVVV